MPTSIPGIISDNVQFMLDTRPVSILDIGCGMGKYGLLAREYLETWWARLTPASWVTRVDGIDACEMYIRDYQHNQSIYNTLLCGQIENVLRDGKLPLPQYEMVLAIDVLEHLDKSTAWSVVLNLLECVVSKAAIFSIPVGDDWLEANQALVPQNKFEKHKSTWTVDELRTLPFLDNIITYPAGPRGNVAVCQFIKE